MKEGRGRGTRRGDQSEAKIECQISMREIVKMEKKRTERRETEGEKERGGLEGGGITRVFGNVKPLHLCVGNCERIRTHNLVRILVLQLFI